MNISIFGLGYVGCVSMGCLAEQGHHIIGVDVSETKVNQVNSGKPTIIETGISQIFSDQHKAGNIEATLDAEEAVLKTAISILSVGTPSTDKGHLNLEYIFKVSENIGSALRKKDEFHIIAVRSTIMPGTCDQIAGVIEKVSGKKRNSHFAVVANPEFLREGTAIKDYKNPPLTLIGSDNTKAAETVADLYRHLPAEIIIADLKVAEILKYVNNTYHALKVSFGNEVGNICKELQIDSHAVMDIFCKDTQLNISPYYFKPGFAYGGSCLPKDLRGLQTLAHDLYVEVPLINSIHKTNEVQIKRAVNILSKYPGKTLGFLGLSFKAGTDDLRNSPAVAVIETLLGKGCDIMIYDQNINLSMLTGTNKEFIDSRIPHLSALLRTDINEVVNESDVIIINNKEPEFNNAVMAAEDKVIIDFVRINGEILSNGNYIGINW
ncbi:MAG: nucleotide sugar dehydrogenase [Bacteroidales bacterium]